MVSGCRAVQFSNAPFSMTIMLVGSHVCSQESHPTGHLWGDCQKCPGSATSNAFYRKLWYVAPFTLQFSIFFNFRHFYLRPVAVIFVGYRLLLDVEGKFDASVSHRSRLRNVFVAFSSSDENGIRRDVPATQFLAVERILLPLLPAEARMSLASMWLLSMKNSRPVSTWLPLFPLP